jgi:hypothetical protein
MRLIAVAIFVSGVDNQSFVIDRIPDRHRLFGWKQQSNSRSL